MRAVQEQTILRHCLKGWSVLPRHSCVLQSEYLHTSSNEMLPETMQDILALKTDDSEWRLFRMCNKNTGFDNAASAGVLAELALSPAMSRSAPSRAPQVVANHAVVSTCKT